MPKDETSSMASSIYDLKISIVVLKYRFAERVAISNPLVDGSMIQ